MIYLLSPPCLKLIIFFPKIKRISKTAQDLLDSGRCNEFGNLILKLIKPAEEEANKKTEEEAKKKAEKRAEEEAKKKAEKKAEKKEDSKASADLNENLPEGIKGRVSRAKQITQESLLRDLTKSQRDVINKYNNWIKNVYENKKSKEQQKEIKENYLSKCSTFNGLLGTIKTFKGE